MADEQDRTETLDDEKLDDVDEQEPPVPLLDDGETDDEGTAGVVGEDETDPAPDHSGAGVPAEEAAMHIEGQ